MSDGLTLYNTLTKAKEAFEPLDKGNVGMYVCGPTVYDYAHIGNARPVVVFDVLFRLLKHLYGDAHVTYVRNITDVDDKIIVAAHENSEDIGDLTTRTTRIFHEDMAALGALPPSIEPRATEHIPDMIAMIESLIEKGHAYANEGHVLFSVPSMDDYGRLSRRNRDEMIAGARVEVAPYKKDPADFILWKPSSGDQPGWDSPWGYGRPGWHIECSAMSARHLGETFDIHGGGVDLVFPHHENEIAQSCCASPGSSFARTWVHNGFLMVEGEKMSKSLGNFITVHELLEEVPGNARRAGEIIRFALLSTHYRQPMDFTKKGLGEAGKTLDRFYRLLDGVETREDTPDEVVAALLDDLNTPQAISALHGYAADGSDQARRNLKSAGAMLGILQQDPEIWFKGEGADDGQIEELIAARNKAKSEKDFARSDAIRDDLAQKGILLEDGPDGTTWRRIS